MKYWRIEIGIFWQKCVMKEQKIKKKEKKTEGLRMI